MKVARNTYTKRAPFLARALRFWLPVFLFTYLLFAEIVLRTLPLQGPATIMGRVVPVPIGYVENIGFIWYGSVLKWNQIATKQEAKPTRQNMLAWVMLQYQVEAMAKEVDVHRKVRNMSEAHGLMTTSVGIAQERGLYQKFAQERVEQMRGLIDLGIYFPDLALQYSSLPSAQQKGLRVFEADAIPQGWEIALASDEPILIETMSDYVFVQGTEQNGEYVFHEIGISKQDMRSTLYAYLLAHPVKWF